MLAKHDIFMAVFSHDSYLLKLIVNLTIYLAQASISFSAKSISSDTISKFVKAPNKKQRIINKAKSRPKQSESGGLVKSSSNDDSNYDSKSSSPNTIEETSKKRTSDLYNSQHHSVNSKSSAKSNKSNSRIDTLILVVHGGNVTCTDTSKKNDFSNFKSTMNAVINAHYGHLCGRFAFRLVACEQICKNSLISIAA